MRENHYEVSDWNFSELSMPSCVSKIQIQSNSKNVEFSGTGRKWHYKLENLEDFANAILDAVEQLRKWET